MKAFTQPLHDLSEYEQIVSDLAGHRTPIHIDGCIDSQKCHLISSIGEPYPLKLIVTYNEIKAKEIYEDYQFFDRNVFYYPAKDIIFYNADIHGNLIVSQRMAVIKRMLELGIDHVIVILLESEKTAFTSVKIGCSAKSIKTAKNWAIIRKVFFLFIVL